jgi:hypothetical protein
MLADLAVDRASNPNFVARDRWNPDEQEEEEEEDDGGELNIIDKSASITLGQRLSVCIPSVTPQRVFQRDAWRHVVRQESTWLIRCIPFWLPWLI